MMKGWSMIKRKIPSLLTLMIAGCLWAASPDAAAAVGKVLYVFGQAQAIGADGNSRALLKGGGVDVGDTLVTINGRVQVRFSDGGFVALQPNTKFRVDSYKFDGKADGTEHSFFNFLKGGIRFVTGVIGHRHKGTYKIRTAVATIGIRGSGGRANMCVSGSCPGQTDGLYLTGEQDVLTITNRTGPQDVYPGDTKYTKCETCKIESIEVAPEARVEVDQTKLQEPEFVSGEQRTDSGASTVFSQAPIGPLVGAFSSNPGGINSFVDATVSGFPPTTTTQLISGNPDTAVLQTAHNEDFFSDGTLFISRWTGGTVNETFMGSTSTFTLSGNQSVHLAYGLPDAPMPTGVSAQATYDFIPGSATHSTSESGATIGSGVTGGQLTVDFYSQSVQVNMDVSHGISLYSVYGSGSVNQVMTSMATYHTFDLSGYASDMGNRSGACASSCSADLSGFLTGSAASSIGNVPAEAGLVYKIYDTDPVSGAAGFKFSGTSVPIF